MGRRQLCLNSSVKSSGAGCTDDPDEQIPNRMRQTVTVTVQKSHILGKCILSEQCAMLSKRLKNTVACCYETYKMRREGKVESPFAFFA